MTLGHCEGLRLGQSISIHTPAWGVTSCGSYGHHRAEDFNPHPRVGGDGEENLVPVRTVDISIHTPAWGVTHIRDLTRKT